MDFLALGSRIKNKRLEKNLTQEQLAEKVDLSAVYIGQIERGERKMTIQTLVKLANVLETSIEELLSDSTEGNLNAKLKELLEIAKKLDVSDLNKVINIIKAMYNELNPK